MTRPYMQVDKNALTRCRLGLVDTQKFRATPYDYMVVLGFALNSFCTKIGGMVNEIRGIHRIHVHEAGKRG